MESLTPDTGSQPAIESSPVAHTLMETKFKVYTYVTLDGDPGTLIVHPDLRHPFDEQMLFGMDRLTVTELSLQDILAKGFIKIGATDLMEDLDIEYPLVPNESYDRNRIRGRHWDHDLQEVAMMFGKDFETDPVPGPVSDPDSVSDSGPDPTDTPVPHDGYVDIDDDDMRQFESVLGDGMMNEIFAKIERCEKTALKDAIALIDTFV